MADAKLKVKSGKTICFSSEIECQNPIILFLADLFLIRPPKVQRRLFSHKKCIEKF
jgi:hypothetical protein